MEMIGLCSICQKPGAMNTCMLCGRMVCSNCFDHKKRVCKQCKIGNVYGKK